MDSQPPSSSSESESESSSTSLETASSSSLSLSLSSTNDSSEKPSHDVLRRCSFAVGFFIISIFSLSYAFGFFALLFATFSIPPSISVPSQCKILSSSGVEEVLGLLYDFVSSIIRWAQIYAGLKICKPGVDLRSTKICELGLLNYKAKRVFYPSERRKFRCRYDYYWASIFKVEYRDHFSGQILFGLSEAPKEALPSDCRPNFSTAWLTKHVLKVNETYDCWYTSGRSKIEIFEDSYFGCQAKDPTWSEMMRRYSILFTKLTESWLSGQTKFKYLGLGAVVGVIGGFFTAIFSVILFSLCGRFLSTFARASAMLVSLFRRLIFSRMFFFLAYFSLVGWLAIQYSKRLGLSDLLLDY